ncbi:MAG: hypothetical protein RRA60_03445 [Chlorobiota bacterium]|nr:hypothetical protein [Chlorobiota bacterium]
MSVPLLASSSAVGQRWILQSVQRWLDQRIRLCFAFNLCEQAFAPWMVQAPEQLPCR